MDPPKERSVRRGNTSGLIGLWNQREENQQHEAAPSSPSPSGSSNVLKIREDAARRISVRSPSPASPGLLGAGLGSSPGRFRKTSEFVRPTFAAAQSSEPAFVASILKEPRRGRSPFKGDSTSPERVLLSTRRAPSPLPPSALLAAVTTSAGMAKPLRSVSPTPLHAEELTVRRGSVGLGRSKSVRCSRVKFGLVSLDDDSDDDDEDGDKDSAKATSGQKGGGGGDGDTADGGGGRRKRTSPFAKFRQMDSQLDMIKQQQSSRFNTASGSRLARQASMPSKSVLLGNQGGGGGGGGGGPDQEAAPPARRPIMRSATSAKETILAWVQAQVNHYDNVNVTNFSTCWNDGIAFCALIHNFYPEAFEFDKLDSRNRRYNFTLAFDVSEKYGDVCPLLDVEDMVRMKKPDWKCVFTYVQSFYRRFRLGREKPSPTKTLFLRRDFDEEGAKTVASRRDY